MNLLELETAAQKLGERDRAAGQIQEANLVYELPATHRELVGLAYEDWVKIREAYQLGIGREAWNPFMAGLMFAMRSGLEHADLAKLKIRDDLGVSGNGVLGQFEPGRLALLSHRELDLVDQMYFQAAGRWDLYPAVRQDRAGQTAVLTGASPLSLGEAVAREILESDITSKLLVFDREINQDLMNAYPGRIWFQRRDLNPITNPRLAKLLSLDLKRGLKKLGRESISLLINNAGIYDFGPLEGATTSKLSDLFGVNVIGHLLMLKAVMDSNHERGINNAEELRLAEIGSFQGISARAGRTAYAASKATGMDICQALAAGREVERALYFAVPSTDTPMLHYNHWATKVGGETEFWRELLENNRELYEGVFLRGDGEALENAIEGRSEDEQVHLRASFAAYCRFRIKAWQMEGREGVATPEEVAASIVHWSISQEPVVVERGSYSDALITYQVSVDDRLKRRLFFEDKPVSFGTKGTFSKHVSSYVGY